MLCALLLIIMMNTSSLRHMMYGWNYASLSFYFFFVLFVCFRFGSYLFLLDSRGNRKWTFTSYKRFSFMVHNKVGLFLLILSWNIAYLTLLSNCKIWATFLLAKPRASMVVPYFLRSSKRKHVINWLLSKSANDMVSASSLFWPSC